MVGPAGATIDMRFLATSKIPIISAGKGDAPMVMQSIGGVIAEQFLELSQERLLLGCFFGFRGNGRNFGTACTKLWHRFR